MSTSTELASSDWRKDSSFSETVRDVQITLPINLRATFRALGLVSSAVILSVCTLLSLGTLVHWLATERTGVSLGVLPALKSASRSSVGRNEAYVHFLPSIDRAEYITSLRTLMYGLQHDPDTRDTTRDIVVMTTPQVPTSVEDQLRSEGAIIYRHDLITSIPNPYDLDSDARWKDQYNKLLLWNLTQYERVHLIDADFLMLKSLEGIWEDSAVTSSTGIAARFMGRSGLDQNYFNSGFFVAYPNRTMFEELLLVRDFDVSMGDIEQALLNKYFRRDGPHPWTTLQAKWATGWATDNDIHAGIYMLHEKCWDNGLAQRGMTNAWRYKVGKMEGHWAAKRGQQKSTIRPSSLAGIVSTIVAY